MKSILVLAVISVLCLRISAQDQIQTYMDEAKQYLAQKEYKQAQLSLQDAINEINNLIAQQIADALPDQVNGLTSDNEEVTGAGVMGIMGGGLQVVKHYSNSSKPENEADLTILANSPMMSMMNMYLSNPGMLGPGYKSTRVGTRRAVMKTEMEDYYDDNGNSKQIRSSEIQIPLTSTMITVNVKGFASEQDELAFAGKLEIEKIRDLLGE